MKFNTSDNYDFIIAGMGCAGLSLAMQLSISDIKFKKVLLIDKELKNKNDRTWCFWTKQEKNWFDAIVFKKWKKFSFKNKNLDKILDLGEYTYMMIRGIDFYEYCLSRLTEDPRFEIMSDTIELIGTRGDQAFLETETRSFSAAYLFNSSFRNVFVKANHINYLQHFKGWIVETEKNAFDTGIPVFMDFDIEQHNDCRFVYVIPFSKTKALVEYTGFSKDQLNDEEYDQELKNYIENKLEQKKYTVLESEKGKIPMYESEFINTFGDKVLNIGTAGGYSKPSTGYTFYFIQKNIQNLIKKIENDPLNLKSPKRKKRYSLYDKILLDVIAQKKMEARFIFKEFFQNNDVEDILAFLNEESSFKQDLKIMNSVPKRPFITSAIKKIWS